MSPYRDRNRVTNATLIAIAAALVLVLAIVGIVGAYVFAGAAADKAAAKVDVLSAARGRDRQAEEVGACLRGDVVRGRIMLKDTPAERARDEKLLPVLDCQATVYEGAGIGVPLTDRQTRKYLTILRTGRVPVILRGGIVR